MASFQSLGPRRPAALQFLINEGVLTTHATPSEYTWTTFGDGEEEVLTTATCAVWSEGNVIRRVFRLGNDDQTITAALLTWFQPLTARRQPPVSARNTASGGSKVIRVNALSARDIPAPRVEEPAPEDASSRRQARRERALVVTVKQHAHIYFSTGPNHIVNLTFEVQRALPTPQGLILERKLYEDKRHNDTASGDDSNLFSSPNLPRTVGGSARHRQSTTIRDSTISLSSFVIKPRSGVPSAVPRLFTLTGPYARPGLVLAESLQNRNASRFATAGVQQLGSDEELLYISPSDETSVDGSAATRPLILAVTINRTQNTYSIWWASYSVAGTDAAEDVQLPLDASFGRSSLRRDSFVTRAGLSKLTASARRSNRQSDRGLRGEASHEQPVETQLSSLATLEATLTSPGKSKRRDRRTSSFVARAELSTNDQSPYTQLGRTPGGLNGSLRGIRGPNLSSFNADAAMMRTAGPVTRSAAKARASLVNSIRQTSTEEDLDMDDDPAGVKPAVDISDGVHDPFGDDHNDLTLTRLFERPLSELVLNNSSVDELYASDLKVFTLLEPDRPRLGFDDVRLMSLYMLHKPSQHMTEVCFPLLRVQEIQSNPSSGMFFVPGNDLMVRRYPDITDAAKVTDGKFIRVINLARRGDGTSVLSLPPAWATVTDEGSLYAPNGIEYDPSDSIIIDLPDQLETPAQNTFDDSANPVIDMQLDPRRPAQVISLVNSGTHGRIDLSYEEGSAYTVQIALAPRHSYVTSVLECILCALPGLAGQSLLYNWWRICGARSKIDLAGEWESMIITLCVLALGYSDVDRQRVMRPHNHAAPQKDKTDWLLSLAEVAQSFLQSVAGARERNKQDWLPFVAWRSHRTQASGVEASALPDLLNILHVLREEMKLNTLSLDSTDTYRRDLLPVLLQLSLWLGYDSWAAAYMLEDEAMERAQFDNVKISGLFIPLAQPRHCPFIYDWLEQRVRGTTSNQFMTVSAIRSGQAGPPKLIDKHITPRLIALINHINRSQELLASDEIAVVSLMDNGLTATMLETYPEAIAVLLRGTSLRAMQKPQTTWQTPLLKLVNREDLQALDGHDAATKAPILTGSSESGLDARGIADSADHPDVAFELRSHGGMEEAISLEKMLQRKDTRHDEARQLLIPWAQSSGEYRPRPGTTDKQFLDEQQLYVRMVYVRTLAKATGFGMKLFSSRFPFATEVMTMPTPNASCKVMPSGSVFSVEALPENRVGWAYFHSGVSTGLAVSRNARGLDASWIVLNKPDEVGVRHAGLILGLGLNGHLGSIPRWLIFKYLTPKHDMTTIGLLLGTSASRLGSMDVMVTKLLSVHVPRLLPLGAAELNLSPLTQAAGLMSVGFLYYNTQHRRMSEILLSELEDVEVEDPINTSAEILSAKNEGYRLAAGCALGLINLGKGSDQGALNGMKVTARLMSVATAVRNTSEVHVLDQATAGATIAIAFIFMKSGDELLARKIAAPDTLKTIDEVRPDILLLRTLAAQIILWHSIRPTKDWIWASLPRCLGKDTQPNTILDVKRHLGSENLVLYNVVTGLCWSIALRFAGTGSVTARDTVLDVYRHIEAYAAEDARTYDEKLVRETLLRCQHHLLLSAATVMAGSGDLEVFRRLRIVYGRVKEDSTFGLHQATMMAVGMLFLGFGRYTFSTSNLAVAALIIACYPLFPRDAADNRAHLQAFRHFWTFAAEPRCIVVRDFDTKLPVVVDLEIVLRNGQLYRPSTETTTAPMLLPELDTISRVSTTTPDYWQVVLDFEHNPKHLAVFKETQTIYVRRRPLWAQYQTTFSLSLATLEAKNVNLGMFERHVLQAALRDIWSLTPAQVADIFPRPNSHGALDKQGVSLEAGNEERSLEEQQLAEHALIPGLLDARTTSLDDTLVLRQSTTSTSRHVLMALRLLFAWTERERLQGRNLGWINEDTVKCLGAEIVGRAKPSIQSRRRPEAVGQGT